MALRLTMVMAAFAVASAPLQAQQVASTLAGQVISSEGAPVVDAEIRLDGAPATIRSDSSGRFAIALARDRVRVQVRALGYTPLDTIFMRGSWQGASLTLRMVRSVQHLAPVVTETVLAYGKPLRYQHTRRFDDFYERRAKRPGTFFTREDIESRGRHTAMDLMSSVAGITINNRPDGPYIRIARCIGSTIRTASRTALAVFVDGQRLSSAGAMEFLTELKASEIETMEVYRGPSQLPMEAVGDACAAVFITTRYTTGSVLTNKSQIP